MGTKPDLKAMSRWLQTLNLKFKEGSFSFSINVGKGYFFLVGSEKDVIHNALMLSPYRSQWGTCMFQSWILGLNPDNPSSLAFPMWVSLRNLPFEHFDQAYIIAGWLGKIIGMETSNEVNKNPHFYINLRISNGWVTSIALEAKDGTLPAHVVEVDYNSLPMRCKNCLSWKHKAKECEVWKRRKKHI